MGSTEPGDGGAREAFGSAAIGDGPHRRHDPLLDQWVLVSAGRTNRPWLGAEEAPPAEQRPTYDPRCYLCPGNTRAKGDVNPAYGSTFVFVNDFSALHPDTPTATFADGLLLAEGERGECRVVCFSPRHDLTLAAMARSDVRCVIDLWAEQTEELGARHRWVQVFENRGAAMGASNPHPHGQIWAGSALPVIPSREAMTQREHFRRTGGRLLLDYVRQESGGPRVVVESDDWLALVPFWASWPFETLLVPKEPVSRLAGLGASARDDLARILHRLLGGYDALFRRPFPYSMGWHQAPFGAEDADLADAWQLHAHFMPPLLRASHRKFMVGYELLAETQRDITAEEAAARLRSAVATVPPDDD
jgi:UDPglucose--hexose-1-phosphate uridylyltransferase